MARPLETTNPPARSCRQTPLRQLATKVRAMRHVVKAPQPNLTWRLLRSLGIMWRVKALKYQGNAPARIGQLNHSCRQCGHCLSSWTNRKVTRKGSSTVRAAKVSMTAGFGGGERCIYDSFGLTFSISGASQPPTTTKLLLTSPAGWHPLHAGVRRFILAVRQRPASASPRREGRRRPDIGR